ncbi:interferon alpha-inducible protein 27-like protein 2A [Sorex araneus]|uniref:interferon alpha-inducible protein 27-like protein 2A n=1 Tax=Sorex araneus TaxID=42254 RepID=UPI002433C6AE|nr:interferon alpha-inducible protein 27-like protein 2A [Sorex araneus]
MSPAVAVAAVPVVLGAVGFTATGITASSLAASMMSSAAVANGGGVAAGSLVATLQSVGAAGLSTASNALLFSSGSALGAWLWGPGTPSSSEEESEENSEPPPSQPSPESCEEPVTAPTCTLEE